MTAAAPDPRWLKPARPGLAQRLSGPVTAGEPASDRIFVTLLSLNFMLLAFFVVLGTTASIDRSRARSIADNVRIVFSGPDDSGKGKAARLSARQALQAGVSDAFADVLPAIHRYYVDNSDRVDVDIPIDVFAGAGAVQERDSVYDGVAHLLQAAPSGYRYVLLLSGGDSTAVSGSAFDFAGALVNRGVAPQDLLVGSGAAEDQRLHMSFLVLEGDLDDAQPWNAGIFDPHAAGDHP